VNQIGFTIADPGPSVGPGKLARGGKLAKFGSFV